MLGKVVIVFDHGHPPPHGQLIWIHILIHQVVLIIVPFISMQ